MSINQRAIRDFFNWDPRENEIFASKIVGNGSIGGKARPTLFAINRLSESGDDELAATILPPSLFISVSAFDDFLQNIPDLPDLLSRTPEYIERAFLRYPLPSYVTTALETFLSEMTDPIAIRSSSLLEDSLRYSFAGKYLSTFLINGDTPLKIRVSEVERDIRRIYARTFFPIAVAYRKQHGLGDDKMAIIVMRVSGKWRGRYYYPTTAGVGFSRYYRRWTDRIKSEDGAIRLVFGLGTTSTKRGYARTFSLTNPALRPEGQNPFRIMRSAQEHFQVMEKGQSDLSTIDIKKKWQDIMPHHSDFGLMAQIYHSDSEDGYLCNLNSRHPCLEGHSTKLCFTFENFTTKYRKFFDRMKKTLVMLEQEMGVPADIEFSYEPESYRLELLQSRPLWIGDNGEASIPDSRGHRLILQANRMVTNGSAENLGFLVYIDPRLYSTEPRGCDVARSLGEVNRLLGEKQYILVAPGRVGSSNPSLGVPLRYDEITGCRCIVELGIPQHGYMPELSFGTHFFTDLEVDNKLYMPVYAGEKNNIYDQPFFEENAYCLGPHPAIRIYSGNFSVHTNGKQNIGIVLVKKIDDQIRIDLEQRIAHTGWLSRSTEK